MILIVCRLSSLASRILAIELATRQGTLGALGQAVRRFRTERGYSQEGFAALVGLHRTYVGGIERGERNPTIKTLRRMAKALNIPVSRLIREMERDLDEP